MRFKGFSILTLVILSILSFFYYERVSFNKYLENQIVQYNMNIPINEKAPVRSQNQIEIEASLDVVWETLTDIPKWPEWKKDIKKAVVHGEIKQGTEFDWKAGGLSFQSRIHTSNPKSGFGWTGTTFGASAIHNWFFESKGNTTVVRVEESLQGVFPILFKGFFQKNLDSGIIKDLQELKGAAEKKVQQ